MVTDNNCMFRLLTGHHQVAYSMKRVGSLYNIQCNFYLIRQKLHCILYNPPTLFIGCTSDDGLLEAETCS